MKRPRPLPASPSVRPARDERWAFNLASESIFALGATEEARRVAYLGPDGRLRFLPRPASS